MKIARHAGAAVVFALAALIAPSFVAAQAGDSAPSTRTVTGTDVGHYTNGPLGVDLSGVTVAALVPNGSGYTTIPGTGTSSGTFTISNVPTGSYLLQLGGSYLATSNTTVDADFTWGDRWNGVPANPGTAVTFNLTNLNSWQTTDVFEMVCTNNGAFIEYDTTDGATAFTGIYPYSPFFISENLSDASQGDQYLILQLSTQNLGSYPFTGAARAFFPGKFTQAQGSDTPIYGTLTTLAQTHQFQANINGADLTAQALAANPSATVTGTALVLDAYPGSVANGERTSTPDLVGYNLSNFAAGPNITTNSNFGTVSYGNPFPATWPLFTLYVWSAQVNYLAPGATNSLGLSTFVQGYNTALPTSASPMKPLIGVVTNPTINGTDFFTAQSGVGVAPTLKWSAPSIGKPTFYVVQIFQLSNVGGNTSETAFTTVRTQRTSLTIPPGVMSSGQGYVFLIRPM